MIRAANARSRFSAVARSALSPASRGITLITLATLVVYLGHGIYAHLMFRTTGYDLGIFDQAIRAYAHFDKPVVPFKGPDYNIWGDHFHPIIATIAPLYWFFNTPYVLIVVQAILLAASVPMVYRFALRRTEPWFALVIAGSYGLGWPMLGLIDFDFHEIAFGMPLLALAIDALDRRNDRQLFLWSALLLLVREDMGIVVATLGFVALIQSGRRRLPALGLIAAGLAAYLIVTSWIIPAFATEGYAYSSQYDALGESLPEIVANIVLHPIQALDLLVTPVVKAKTLAYLFLPLALLPLRSPYVLIAAPLLAGRMFNSRENLWQAAFHYNALPWLVLVLATIDAAHKMGFNKPTEQARRWRVGLAAWVIVVPVLVVSTLNPVAPRPKALWEMRGAFSTTGVRPSVQQWHEVMDLIPANTCVEADNRLAPHLTTSNYVSLVETQRGTADIVVIDIAARDTGGNDGRPPMDVLAEYRAAGYRDVRQIGSVVVLQAKDYTGPSDACRPLGPGKAG